MLHLAGFVTVLGLGAQIGTIVFYSFVLTPVYFGYLTRQEAGRAVRLGFPGYYLTQIVGLLAAGLGVGIGGGTWAQGLAVSAALGVEVYACAVLLPQIVRTRPSVRDAEQPDESDPAHVQWRALHRLSVQLNLAALGFGLVALWLVSTPAGPS